MTTDPPVSLCPDPRVLTFPGWLMHDLSVARPVRALRRAPGATLWHDARTAVLILPEACLDAADARVPFYALLDELTVWRLSTADGARGDRKGCCRGDAVTEARLALGVRVRVAS